MSDGTLPAAPPPPPASPNSFPPPTGTTGLRKSHLGLGLGVALALFLAIRMFSGSSSSSGTAASSDNPLIGSWTLADTDKDYCGTHEEFKADSTTEVKGGVTTTYPAIYLIKPGYVDVSEGNVANYAQWDETGPDEITYRINSLYVVASCKYHRD